jgi:hypothetical protein
LSVRREYTSEEISYLKTEGISADKGHAHTKEQLAPIIRYQEDRHLTWPFVFKMTPVEGSPSSYLLWLAMPPEWERDRVQQEVDRLQTYARRMGNFIEGWFAHESHVREK